MESSDNTNPPENSNKVDYTFSKDDIKFPNYYSETLDTILRKENMSFEILKQDLTQVNTSLSDLSNVLINLVKNDTNEFDTNCKKYSINSYDFIILLKLAHELSSLLFLKFTDDQTQINSFKLSKFEDFFSDESTEKDIFSNQYKTFDQNHLEIKEKTSLIFSRIKHIYDTPKFEGGIPFYCYLLKFLLYFLNKVNDQLNKFSQIQNFKNEDDKQYKLNMIVYFDLMFILKKIQHIDFVLYYGFYKDKNDIFNFEENSPEWSSLKNIMYKVNTSVKDSLITEYANADKEAEKLTLLMNKAIDFDSNIVFNLTRIFAFGIFHKIKNDNDLITFETKEILLTSNRNVFEDMMRLFKISFFKKMMSKSFGNIEFREKIYMKKENPELNIEYIKKLLCLIYDKDIINKNFENIKEPEKLDILDENKSKQLPIWSQKVIKEDKKYYVSTRLLNTFKLQLNIPKIQKRFSITNFFTNETQNTPLQTPPKYLLIHVHGGGFLECSEFMQEFWFRKVCNELKIPILTMNYRGAPKHPYPQGLNDFYQCYLWMLSHCEKELGFKPEKIIFSGDSSGGNFILALTLLIIAMNKYDNKNIRLPDLIFGLYPCCNVGTNTVSLSLCLSIEDSMLNTGTLYYVNKSYRDYYKNELDPFLNPVVATEELLKDLPPLRFMIGGHDPLRDDAIQFCYKLTKIQGKDIKLMDFCNYSHGFMGSMNEKIREPAFEVYCKEVKEFLDKWNNESS